MSTTPVVREHAYCLAHVPELVQFASKPMREIARDYDRVGDLLQTIAGEFDA